MFGRFAQDMAEIGGRLFDAALAACLLGVFFLGPALAERGLARIDGHTSFVAENRG